MTPAELKRLQKKPPRVRGAQRTTIDGITFHSKGEALRFQALRLLERAGQIRNLQRQAVFLIEIRGVFVCRYIADFTYIEPPLADGRRRFDLPWTDIVEDFKGHITDAYRIKRALMLAVHGVTIRETRADA